MALRKMGLVMGGIVGGLLWAVKRRPRLKAT
jgi:hypothetical protein